MKLASIFTDHAVFQRGLPIRVFGEGAGKVKIKFLSETVEYSTNEDKWCVTLSPRETYGGPYQMQVELDGALQVLNDIYVGEVWLAGGQSNMEMPLFRTEYGIDEARGCENDKIRFFTVPRRVKRDTPEVGWNFEPTDGEDKPWQLCCEESALHFTAIGYYVAKELCLKLGCAVGVISCNWGGTPLEPFIGKKWIKEAPFLKDYYKSQTELYADWTPEKLDNAYRETHEAFKRRYLPEFDVIKQVSERGVSQSIGFPTGILPTLPDGPFNPNTNMGILYDSMYSRIIPYGIKGILWYQGESNVPDKYCEKYQLYMKCMRESFENPALSFYAVELASFATGQVVNGTILSDRFVEGGGNWAFKREEQEKATKGVAGSYLVTSMGLGDPFDIHPTDKKNLSHRMALKVLKHDYCLDLLADQPIFKEAVFDGDTVRIRLDNAEGLYCNNLACVNIYLADESRILKKAEIVIDGDGLMLSTPEVKEPIYVRYAFDNYYVGGYIYNRAGLPLAPFRARRVK